MNGERGRSRLGRLHVEAFQDTFDVLGLRQKQLSFGASPTNLHSEDVPCRTEVLFTTGEKISSKSTPYSCRNPFATNLALYFGVVDSDVSFS